jgi:two-component system, LuxR family, sensor kinase FixL
VATGQDEVRFRAVIDTAVDGIILIDARGTVLVFNPACEKLFGYRADEVIGQNVKMLMPPPYRDEHDGYLGNYLRSGERKIIGIGREVVGRRKDGSTFPMELSVGETQESGEKTFVGIIHDITERKQHDQALRESEARVRAVVDTAVDGVILIDTKGSVLMFNPACEKLFGYRAADVIGQNVKMLMPPPFKQEHDRYLENYHWTGKRRIIGIGREVVGQRKDGSTFPMHLSVGEATHGGETTFVGIIHDLTERTLAEGRRAQLAAIVDSSSDAVIGMDFDGTITSWNRGAGQMYGYRAAEIVGRPITVLEPPERRGEMAARFERLRRSEDVSRYEAIGLRKDGQTLDISVSLSPIRSEPGQIIGFSKTARDVTELRQAERQVQQLTAELVHTARLSAMGQLSSALAHELNQPLTAVMNYAEAARHMLSGVSGDVPTRVRDMLEKTSTQAGRAGQIMRRLRSFVEKGPSERAAESLNRIVEEASVLASTGARLDGIEVVFELTGDLPPVEIDKIQIQQVVVNLVRNAVEVLRQAERRRLVIRTAAAPDGLQEVAIIDTGPGIAPEIAAQLFKPFVTTKKDGMGIGLSISQSIVEAHGGRLSNEPNPGGGTIFRFTVPGITGHSA